ncbi:MAG TPA: HIT family protein, partial [Candidatus Micrarchaeaceae archaeon]|nr:HIT family protein [Candidatus Micrarchaeaceae archaeon]
GTAIEIGELWSTVLNRNQNLLGKCMIVLNRTEIDVGRLTEDEWSDLLTQIARLRSALDSLFRPDHYNYAFLMNQDAQVHLHVLPRYKDSREWDGLQFIDPSFGSMWQVDARVLDSATLSRMAEAIAKSLG